MCRLFLLSEELSLEIGTGQVWASIQIFHMKTITKNVFFCLLQSYLKKTICRISHVHIKWKECDTAAVTIVAELYGSSHANSQGFVAFSLTRVNIFRTYFPYYTTVSLCKTNKICLFAFLIRRKTHFIQRRHEQIKQLQLSSPIVLREYPQLINS